jgi:hypothetical protein
MPQLDVFTFFNQLIYFITAFVVIYFFAAYYLTPHLLFILKLRGRFNELLANYQILITESFNSTGFGDSFHKDLYNVWIEFSSFSQTSGVDSSFLENCTGLSNFDGLDFQFIENSLSSVEIIGLGFFWFLRVLGENLVI